MSFVSFYKTFKPTEEEKKWQEIMLEWLHKEAIDKKACVVCQHYSFDDSVPGFVTYQGECELGFTPFFSREKECIHWQEQR